MAEMGDPSIYEWPAKGCAICGYAVALSWGQCYECGAVDRMWECMANGTHWTNVVEHVHRKRRREA
jgi:hypothetical protein